MKEAVWKVYILEVIKKIRDFQGLVWREEQIGGVQRIFMAVKLLYMILKWWAYVIIYLPKPIKCSTPSVNPNGNYELWMMMYQYRFINCKQCFIWWEVFMGGGAKHMWKQVVYGKSLCLLFNLLGTWNCSKKIKVYLNILNIKN